jgi:hypothetical protein
MNKYLPDNIDDFFSSRLKDYSEKPEENIWNEIDKNLPNNEKSKPLLGKITVSGTAAILLVCLCMPFSIKDNFIHRNSIMQNKAINHIPGNFLRSSPAVFDNIIKANHQLSNKPANKNAITASLQIALKENYFNAAFANNINSKKGINSEHSYSFSNNFFTNDSMQGNKLNEYAPTSTIIKLHSKHLFSLTPFFSFDHITGRFIEQYEFDNLDENDLANREKPDVSFTAGVLGAYQLSKKLSLVSGISYSSSKLSVAGTAVKALQNDNGEYIFKLATSYGFAEIGKKGISPVAGDTLLVSSTGISFNYISLPIMINYDVSGRRLKFCIHGGVAVNIITNEKVEAEYKVQNNSEVETTNKIEGIKKTFFTLNTGVEANYELNHTTDISIGPELRYGIDAINKGTPVKTYPVNYGLALKLKFKL